LKEEGERILLNDVFCGTKSTFYRYPERPLFLVSETVEWFYRCKLTRNKFSFKKLFEKIFFLEKLYSNFACA
jgi:hypothetical protein